MQKPLEYYHNNITGLLNLLNGMRKYSKTKDVAGNPLDIQNRLIFSSSACVYGEAKTMPLTESAETKPTSPYGHTKLMTEQILEDLSKHFCGSESCKRN